MYTKYLLVTALVAIFGFALAGSPQVSFADAADDACYPALVACNDAAQKMAGLITKNGTPSNLAWKACNAANNACKDAIRAKNNPSKPPVVQKPAVKPKAAPVKNALPSIRAEALNIKGEVEVSTDGGKTFRPWTKGTTLKYGDFIGTGAYGSAVLKLPYGTVSVGQLTQLRVDEFLNENNLQRTRMNLRIGDVTLEVKEKRPTSMRSDFSVVTPAAIASIRGSSMKVAHDKKLGTTITALEGTTYWKKVGGNEEKLLAGASVTIALNGKATANKASVVPTPGKSSKIILPAKTSNGVGLAGKWKLVRDYKVFAGGPLKETPIVKRLKGDGEYVSFTADNKMCLSGTVINGAFACDNAPGPITVKGDQIVLAVGQLKINFKYVLRNNELEISSVSPDGKPVSKSIYVRVK
ncbi:MAG: FecR domain-containing protein [Candidatus Vogelbacteria bacterium]|nr:FecR domain-containing protein [Candidatus Vogelbacteria bacterium]